MSDAKATIAARTWSPSSWRSLESLQMASYEAADAPEKIFDKLSKLPPLVQSTEVDALKELLAAAARGERFIVQGGDCAERFMDCETDRLWRQLGVLFQMGEIVSKSTGKGAVRIARIAGQYGKPRSKPTEVVEGHGEIMSFKGDNINGYPVEERKWDPKRLLEGYFHSAATLNYLRGVVSSGGLECLAELDNAVQTSKSANIEWDNDIPLNVSQGNFPLSKMADTIAEMSDELENGMGAAMIANIPVDKYSLEELSVMYLGICSYIGNVVQQSSAGLRSKSRGYGMPLGHVKAEMRGKTPLDGKQSNNYFRLHTDRCDMISLLSVRTASQGGHGRVALSDTLAGQTTPDGRLIVDSATLFLSHAWMMETGEFLDVTIANMGEEDYAWIDIFVYPQFSEGDGSTGAWIKRFDNMIVGIGKVVAVMNRWRKPIPLERIWCLFELVCAMVRLHSSSCPTTMPL